MRFRIVGLGVIIVEKRTVYWAEKDVAHDF